MDETLGHKSLAVIKTTYQREAVTTPSFGIQNGKPVNRLPVIKTMYEREAVTTPSFDIQNDKPVNRLYYFFGKACIRKSKSIHLNLRRCSGRWNRIPMHWTHSVFV